MPLPLFALSARRVVDATGNVEEPSILGGFKTCIKFADGSPEHANISDYTEDLSGTAAR